jgi:histidine triad (HIT) family protein
VVGEGESWMAFFPLAPATEGHTLVVPRVHVADLWHADEETAKGLATACLEIGRALESVLTPEGMNLITSAGEVAEQTVFHLHFHVVPRWRDDKIGPIWPPSSDDPERASEELADEVRRALGSLQGE